MHSRSETDRDLLAREGSGKLICFPEGVHEIYEWIKLVASSILVLFSIIND